MRRYIYELTGFGSAVKWKIVFIVPVGMDLSSFDNIIWARFVEIAFF